MSQFFQIHPDNPQPRLIKQAVEIIRQRVDGSGVAEAEVATQGSQNVVVSLPGVPDEETRRLIQASADMQFRPVLQSGPGEATPEDQRLPEDQLPKPDGEPADAYDPNWVTPALLAEFQATDCTAPRDPAAPPPPSDRAIVACQPSEELADGAVTPAQKYILGPVVIPGTQIKGASNGMAQAQSGVSTNQWVVNIDFDEEGAKAFTEVTQKLTPYPEGDPRKQFAILLDGDVISAPQSNVVITNGSAQISGPTLNEQTTAQLAEQLNYGSLPISFSIESEQQISATLGRDQLFWGLIAGLIGLGLVAVYQFFQYRALGLLTFASIIVAGVLTWLTIAILGWTDNYRLSLAGIAGLIVAIGLTADSFIVYFERIKDELRAGHTVPVAVHEGWKRARRTITASKAVNLLAAVVLYFVAVGNVRGFAFTLGLTAIADLIVVPVASSQVDLWATEGVLDLAQREKRPVLIVLNRVRPNTRLGAEVAASAAELAQGPAFDNLMIAAANLRRAATALGKEPRIFCVALDFALEELSGSATAYRDAMIALMARIEAGLAAQGYDRPLFVTRLDAGAPGRATEAQDGPAPRGPRRDRDAR